ncbi:carcinoembryonic antigen-related cell adhesion molecule 5 [Chanos chanos]|uniref:Carcinoembryonic antigen-related cell adhesion molecule 5 n=1 Tax=Chanos chanos TaxID=29144 RepID=A0A6J2WV73_CHACN|nr:carcinoembryonic antigen-related cell adhesion molecule 5-like [Chanos chanos]
MLLLFVTFLGCWSGSLSQGAGKVKGVLGKNVTLEPTIDIASSGNLVTMTWTFKNADNDIVIYTGLSGSERYDTKYVNRAKCNKTTGVLRLSGLTKADNGDYTLSIVGTDNSIADAIELEVLEPVSGVKIMSSLSEAVEFNSTVVLNCTAKGSYITYKWKNGSSSLQGDGTHIQLSSNGQTVTVNNVFRTDLQGPIYCIAENPLESETSAPFNLTVSYGPDNIVMTVQPMQTTLKKGSNLTLTCSAQSSPAASLQWMHNGADLKQETGKLTLANLQEKDNGNYSCVAYNSKTKRYATSAVAVVTVIEALSGTNITGPSMPLIAGKSTANLTCEAAAGKATKVMWLKDGKPLSLSNRVALTADEHTLTFSSLERTDNGMYKCVLSNAVGESSAQFRLDVNFGPEESKISGPEAVEIHDPVLLNCSVQSKPTATYTWTLNGTVKDQTSSVYTINNPSYKDSGTYVCTAYNPVTGRNQSATHVLSVKEEGALDEEGLSGGAIAGIVIACVIVIVVIACVVYCRRNNSEDGDSAEFEETLIGQFPKLKEEGGFDLLKSVSGNSKALEIVKYPDSGYSAKYIREQAFVRSGISYIHPLQQDLDNTVAPV